MVTPIVSIIIQISTSHTMMSFKISSNFISTTASEHNSQKKELNALQGYLDKQNLQYDTKLIYASMD
jgi:hypothetical protein